MQDYTGEELIRAGAAAINSWTRANPQLSIEAPRVTFELLDLSGANLSGADLRNCAFLACNLSQANFQNANLENCTFSNCKLTGSDFSNAKVRRTNLDNVELSGAKFLSTSGLSRINILSLSGPLTAPIKYNWEKVGFFDQWVRWDRLRFLGTIKIFVPAYTSVALTVLYLNFVSGLNSAGDQMTRVLRDLTSTDMALGGPLLTPTWTPLIVLLNFLLLAAASTAFLACPARVLEYTRTRWIEELHASELLYDNSSWKYPWLRGVCFSSLTIGGVISLYLLVSAVISQASFILSSLR